MQGGKAQRLRNALERLDPTGHALHARTGLAKTRLQERDIVTRTLHEVDASRARRAQVVDKMAAAYILQGALDRLAQEGLLKTTDVAGLNNGERQPVVLAFTCVAGRYGVPGFDCLGELLLLKEGGGAAAVWAPSGLSMNTQAMVLDEGFMQSRFTDGERVVGAAVLSALEDYGASGNDKYMLRIYNLLGDPALHVK